MKIRAALFSALLIGCLAGTAQATTTATKNEWSEVVSYDDLDLSNEAHAAILLQRVKDAAHRVCIRSGALLALDFPEPMQRCTNDATSRAIADLSARSITVSGGIGQKRQ
jgi:UrcA family protein